MVSSEMAQVGLASASGTDVLHEEMDSLRSEMLAQRQLIKDPCKTSRSCFCILVQSSVA